MEPPGIGHAAQEGQIIKGIQHIDTLSTGGHPSRAIYHVGCCFLKGDGAGHSLGIAYVRDT